MKGEIILQNTAASKLIVIDYIADIITQQTEVRYQSQSDTALLSCWSLIFIRSGKAAISVGERTFFTDDEAVVLVPSDVPHSVLSTDGSLVCYTTIVFDTSSEYIKNVPIVPLRCRDEIMGILKAGLEFAEQNLKNGFYTYAPSASDPRFENFNVNLHIMQSYLELFLLSASIAPTPAPSKESHKQTRHANITQSVEEYLKEHVRENISLLETAQHFGYSVSNIQKIFKSVTGQSIIVYFNHLKLEAAKRLIADSSMTFSQISNYLSFSNPNYFSRIFKTTVGMTPTEYAAVYGKKSDEDAAPQRGRPTVKKD